MNSFSDGRIVPLGEREPLTLFYCDHDSFPLPEGHKFPLMKYRMLREKLRQIGGFAFQTAPEATRDQITRAHSAEYVDAFLAGTLDAKTMRRIGFPWSPELVKRTLASAGGTLAALKCALVRGFGGTLAGGTHHAMRSEGAGFCVFNDLAIAVAEAKGLGLRRVAIIDLDVHQGDGTAAICGGDSHVFTLSLHGARNFPFRKQRSTLDIELADGVSDKEYLDHLRRGLNEVLKFEPELVLYQAGVDALDSDRLGRLALSMEGLRRRDEMVLSETQGGRIPTVITLGGGYSEPIERTVDAHSNTFQIALRLYDR